VQVCTRHSKRHWADTGTPGSLSTVRVRALHSGCDHPAVHTNSGLMCEHRRLGGRGGLFHSLSVPIQEGSDLAYPQTKLPIMVKRPGGTFSHCYSQFSPGSLLSMAHSVTAWHGPALPTPPPAVQDGSVPGYSWSSSTKDSQHLSLVFTGFGFHGLQSGFAGGPGAVARIV
jgi:hypothetical protein